MDTIVSVYIWGVIVALLFQIYGMLMYLFGTSERIQYQRNLNRAGISWDPIYFKIYNASDFRHTVVRYWLHTAWGLVECFFSWVSVCGRVYRIMKLREITGMLTPEQKQAGFALRNVDLPKEEVFQKLTILDSNIRAPGTFRFVGVDSEEFFPLFAKVLVDNKARHILVPLFEASGMNVTKREMAFLKYAVGKDPDNANLKALFDEYRSTDVPDRDRDVFLKQLDAVKAAFGIND